MTYFLERFQSIWSSEEYFKITTLKIVKLVWTREEFNFLKLGM